MQFAVSGSYNIVSKKMFGGQILASRDVIDDAGNFEALVRDLGVTALRYPGGSLTEYYFDIKNPNRSYATDPTGHFSGSTDKISFVPLSEFLEFSRENKLSVSIVLPTRELLSFEVDANGNRYEAVDEAALRNFINSVVNGHYGNANITAFEIGNEYWGSGEMTSIEYGRVSSVMARIVGSELLQISQKGNVIGDIDVVVQSGHNIGSARLSQDYEGWSISNVIVDINSRYGLSLGGEAIYASGGINWAYIANKLIISQFNKNELSHVDAIAPHLYTGGSDLLAEVGYTVNLIEKTWGGSKANLEIHATEWNQNTHGFNLSGKEDYGLWQGHEILQTFSEMLEEGVDSANVWPLLQNTYNALSRGFSHEGLSPAGELYSMMSSSLINKALISSVDNTEQADSYLYYGQGQMVAFIASKSEQFVSVDLTSLLKRVGNVEAVKLGVIEGDAIGDGASRAVYSQIDSTYLQSRLNWTFEVDAGEIIMIILSDLTPQKNFSELLESIDVELNSITTGVDELGKLLIGGDGDDRLIGGAGDDTLDGGLGSDVLFGGDGIDTVDYAKSSGSLRVDLMYPYLNTNIASGDTFHSIENIFGSMGADNLRGTYENNFIKGMDNVDYLYGRQGNDTLNGGVGDDVLFGGAGRDILIGGTGRDRAQYSESQTAVYLDLEDPRNNTGEALGDIYHSIEDLAGGAHDDTIFGDQHSNRLFGREGADLLIGRSGDDYLNGGAHSDTLIGGMGNDTLRGGGNSDEFVFQFGNDTIEDLTPSQGDLLVLDAAVLTFLRGLSVERVVEAYGSVGDDGMVLDFGDFGSVSIEGIWDPDELTGFVEIAWNAN